MEQLKNSERKLRRHQECNGRRLFLMGLAIATSLFIILTQFQRVNAHNSELTKEQNDSLPAPQIHPLPTPLAQWQDATDAGDYFSQIKPTPLGYLIWSQFPIRIYVERPKDPTEASASIQRFQKWVDAVLQAVQEWTLYLPLEVVTQPEVADIAILHERPPLQASFNRETGQFNIPRARSAETRYEFYLGQAKNASQQILLQRFTIKLSPHQTADYTLATARHELGHALGIWGHSPFPTDTMYFSQVRNPPQISARDINTLKRIYEQPTRLGWTLIVQ
ncbi:MAG TPA: peptidase [Coleofasciculaceae cyanobacterium]